MLKYTISKDSFLNKDNKVQVISSTRNEMLGIYGDTKLLFLCECDSIDDFTIGMQLLGRNDVTIIQDDMSHTGSTYTFTETLTVTGVNSDDVTLAMLIDKYVPLTLTSIGLFRFTEQNEDDNGVVTTTNIDYVYFYFQNSHYFPNPTYTYRDSTNPPSDNLYLRYGADGDEYITIDYNKYEYITATTLRVKASYIPSTVREQLFGGKEPSETEPVEGHLDDIEVYRDTFLYDYDEANDYFSYSLYFDRPIQVLQLPLSQSFSGNLLHEMAVQQDFVDVKKAEAINGIIDMEKDVYHPVIATTTGDGLEFTPVYKLIFNLHFRQHRGDDWTVSNDDYWNGTYNSYRGSYESIELMDKSSATYNGYFSYKESGNTGVLQDESYQSDLLTYLDFTNEDVRYQKNKVKKSFLRLSFYDSMNPANQNLLYYSTIFVDPTKLFSRYSKHFESTSYSLLDYDSGETKLNLSGIRVSREPYGERVQEAIEDDNDIETVRLSSQLVVQDKYNASSSSEGFYLYIWRDNENPLPQDLYMKAEFNHAGHGRSLPMMVPYWDDDEKQGFKSFAEIVEDWNIADKNGDPIDGDVGYGIQRYLRYSYVHFKYRYDIETQQHIYYLDNELYGDSNMSTVLDNTLILNLYEAKIGAQSASDGDVVTYCYDFDNMIVTLSYKNIPGEGGTVTPTVTYSLDVYECNDEGEINPEAYIRTLTEKNSNATLTYSNTGNCLCENVDGECICKASFNESTGAVTLNEANESDTDTRTVFSEITVTVALNNYTKTATASVIQDAGAEKTYEYSDLAITLSYNLMDPEGECLNPIVEYSYTRTDEEGNSETITDYTPISSGVVILSYYGSYDVVDPNMGEVCAGANNTEGTRRIDIVTVTMEIKDTNQSATAQATVKQDYADVFYDNVVINSLTYSNIPCEGGSTYPTLSYSQYWYDREGNDGYITNGADVTYSFDKNSSVSANQQLVDATTGEITADGVESDEEQLLGAVSVEISLNGKTATTNQNVYQDACGDEEIIENFLVFDTSGGQGGVIADGDTTDPTAGTTFTIYSATQDLRADYKLTLRPTSNSFTICITEGNDLGELQGASWCEATMYLYVDEVPTEYIGSVRVVASGVDGETTCTECYVNDVELPATNYDRKVAVGCTAGNKELRWAASVFIGEVNLAFDAILTRE